MNRGKNCKVLPRMRAAIARSDLCVVLHYRKTLSEDVLWLRRRKKNYSMTNHQFLSEIIKKNLPFRFDISENLINWVILMRAKI